MINFLKNLGMEHNTIKAIYDNRRVLTFSTFIIVFEVLATAIREGKKRDTDIKGRTWVSLFSNDMILYIRDSKDSTGKLLIC